MSNGSPALSHEKGIKASELASQTELIHLRILPVATRLSTEKLHASLIGKKNASGYATSDYLVILRENMEAPGIQLLLGELRLSLWATADRLPLLTCAL